MFPIGWKRGLSNVEERFDIVIVGAGIIGALAAWMLGQSGYRVALVDRGAPGGQASNAAAGILSPTAEVDQPGPFWDLAASSLARYAPTISRLEEESGMRVDFTRSGVLQIAGEDESQALLERFAWQRDVVPDLNWLDERELARVEPALGQSAPRVAIFAPGEAQVNAPKMVQAAVRAATRMGVVLLTGEPVVSILTEPSGKIAGVRLMDGQTLWARRGVVLAAGAWLGLIAQSLGLSVPVVPIRGQVLGLNSDQLALRRIVFSGHQYACPKPDGRLIVGATEDAVGFDARTSAAGVIRLSRVLEGLNLPVDRLLFDRVWAGLRPKAADGLPLIGTWPGHPGLFVAGGHYRNGVLLSVITAEWIRDWAFGEVPPPAWGAFRPDRLTASAAAD